MEGGLPRTRVGTFSPATRWPVGLGQGTEVGVPAVLPHLLGHLLQLGWELNKLAMGMEGAI